MFLSVMAFFFVYAVIFILFDDYNRTFLQSFDNKSDLHLLVFSVVAMGGLAWVLHRYAHRMDERISREQAESENKMRRELTHNIAHELKTPVASILGYTETILDNPEITAETRDLFIQRTHAQAERLTSLLQDISTLNRMDYASNLIAMGLVDVADIVADIEQEVSISLAHKEMKFHNCLPQSIVIRGNASLLYSVFRNLFDNAINYAGNGTTIEITAQNMEDYWEFSFSDNGQGIADEHLPRIFERFYRIDKGRSRQLGGTGLGLSIVKNAVVLHGGTIMAHRGENGGLYFDFTLRK